MTGTPLAARPVASWRAWSMPRGVGWRVPTTATDVASRSSAVPRMNRTGGCWWIMRRLDGYSGSRTQTIRMPARSHRSRSRAASSRSSAGAASNSEPWAGPPRQRLPVRCRIPRAARSPLTRRLRVVAARQPGRPAPHASSLPAYPLERMFAGIAARIVTYCFLSRFRALWLGGQGFATRAARWWRRLAARWMRATSMSSGRSWPCCCRARIWAARFASGAAIDQHGVVSWTAPDVTRIDEPFTGPGTGILGGSGTGTAPRCCGSAPG